MPLASRTSRLFAQLLDGLIGAIPFFAATIVIMVNDWLGVFAMVGAGLFWIGYYFLADGLPNGQSIGKRAFNIAVVDGATGEPCTMWKSFLRNLLLCLLGPIDWLFIFGERRQRLGDMAAGTIVVSQTDPLAAEGF